MQQPELLSQISAEIKVQGNMGMQDRESLIPKWQRSNIFEQTHSGAGKGRMGFYKYWWFGSLLFLKEGISSLSKSWRQDVYGRNVFDNCFCVG